MEEIETSQFSIGVGINNEDKESYINKIYTKFFFTNDDKYVCQLCNDLDQSTYVGILNDNYSKNVFGFMKYNNGDLYCGEWKENKKDGNGIYFYHNGDVFCGTWKDNIKNDFGIYFWVKGKNFKECFLGKFLNDRRMSGLSIMNEMRYPNFDENNDENFDTTYSYIYHGEFIDSKKCCNNSYLYDYERDIVFYGNIMNDIAQEGYQFKLCKENDEINISSAIKFKVSPLNPNSVIEIEEMQAIIEERSTEIIVDKCKLFYESIKRNNFIEHCGLVYVKLKKIKKISMNLNSFLENMIWVKELINDVINENIRLEKDYKI